MIPGNKKFLALTAGLTMLIGAGCTKPATKRYAYTCPDGYEFVISYSDQGDPGFGSAGVCGTSTVVTRLVSFSFVPLDNYERV